MIVSVNVPFKTQHNGRKKFIVLKSYEHAQPKYKPNETLIKAIAKALYWQKLIDEGKYSGTEGIARKYRINKADVMRILNLNLLAPAIRKAIMDGAQPRAMNLQMLKKGWPDMWEKQMRHFGF